MMMGVLILEHLRSNQGILKIAELVLLLVAYVCVRATWYTSVYAFGFYEGVTLGYSVTIVVFLFLTIFGVPNRISFVNWSIVEFFLDAAGFIFVSTGSIVAAVKCFDVPALIAASVCGLLASYLLVGSAILSFFAARRSAPVDQPV